MNWDDIHADAHEYATKLVEGQSRNTSDILVRLAMAYLNSIGDAVSARAAMETMRRAGLADSLRAIEEWSGAEMWRRKSGPSTSKGDMRVQAMAINDRARAALGLRRRPRRDWLQDEQVCTFCGGEKWIDPGDGRPEGKCLMCGGTGKR